MAEVNINGGEAEYALADHSEYKRKMEPYQEYRVGNFKVELVKRLVNGKGEGRTLLPKAHYKKDFLEKNGWEEIYALRITRLDSTGEVIIPQHYDNFRFIVSAIRREDAQSMAILSEIVNNMDIALKMPLCGELECFMALVLDAILNKSLSVGDKKKVYEELKGKFNDYLDKDLLMYEKEPVPKEWTEKEYHQAEVADEAKQVLEKEARNGQ